MCPSPAPVELRNYVPCIGQTDNSIFSMVGLLSFNNSLNLNKIMCSTVSRTEQVFKLMIKKFHCQQQSVMIRRQRRLSGPSVSIRLS